MIKLRHFHDQRLVFEDAIPFPSMEIQAQTLAKIIIKRSREAMKFEGTFSNVQVVIIVRPRKRIAALPKTPVPDSSIFFVNTASVRAPVEEWDLDNPDHK